MFRKLTSIALPAVLLSMALNAELPSGGNYVISKSTIDNGGGVSSGGDFVLTGTIGQPDANSSVSVGGEFEAAGGFWASVAINLGDLIFKDGFE